MQSQKMNADSTHNLLGFLSLLVEGRINRFDGGRLGLGHAVVDNDVILRCCRRFRRRRPREAPLRRSKDLGQGQAGSLEVTRRILGVPDANLLPKDPHLEKAVRREVKLDRYRLVFGQEAERPAHPHQVLIIEVCSLTLTRQHQE